MAEFKFEWNEDVVDIRTHEGKLLGHLDKTGNGYAYFDANGQRHEFHTFTSRTPDDVFEQRYAIYVDDVEPYRHMPTFREPGPTFTVGEPDVWPPKNKEAA